MLNNKASIQIYEAIAETNEEREYEHWHASSIGMCPRAHYLKRKGEPETAEKPSGAKILRWDAGHHMETGLRKYLKVLYPDLESNKRFTSKEYDLTGEFDNYNPATQRLIEVKTVHDYAFIERDGITGLKEQDGWYVEPDPENNVKGRKKWKLKDTPYLHHELQNHAYALLLDEIGLDVKGIDYVYVSLSGRVVVYSTELQEELTNNVLRRLEVLNKAWEADEPPECICREEHPLYDGVMQYCPYKTEDGCCGITKEK